MIDFDDGEFFGRKFLSEVPSGVDEMRDKIRSAYRHNAVVRQTFNHYQHLMGIKRPEDVGGQDFYIMLAYNTLRAVISMEERLDEYVRYIPKPLIIRAEGEEK